MLFSGPDLESPEVDDHIWRLRFCRLTPSSGCETVVHALQSHPAARLPYFAITSPCWRAVKACPTLVMGPGGLLIFEADTCYDPSPAIVLDWKSGEARGVGAGYERHWS